MAIDTNFTQSVSDSLASLNYELEQAHEHSRSLQSDPAELVQMKGTICLATRNLWDEFLFGLGEFDPGRNRPDYEYSDDTRLKLVPQWRENAQMVLDSLRRSIDVFDELLVPEHDPYRQSVKLKFEKLQSVLR